MKTTAPADSIAGIRRDSLLMTGLRGRRGERKIRAIAPVAMRRMDGQAGQYRAQEPHKSVATSRNATLGHTSKIID